MALKGLTIEEMEQVSGAWIDPANEAHQALSAEERLQGLLAEVETAHAELHVAVPEDDPRAKELARLAAEVDGIHDLLARGIWGYLTEVALLVDDGEPLIQLRGKLMPEGLGKVVQNTYRGQAGFAALLRQRLTATERQELGALPLPGNTSLLDAVDRWLDAGDRLGALEEEKARLDEASPTIAGRIHNARNRWIRVVNVVIATAELAQLSEAADRAVFGPLRDAELKADQRAARRSAGDTPAEPETTPAEG